MPFEIVNQAAPPSPSRWAWLRSQGLGLICGQATVLLLAIGSVVIVATKEDASKGIGLDDIRGFFEAPSIAHVWLYLLLGVMALYAVNTLLATWETVVGKWRNGVRAPAPYAASVVHLGFLVAALAHLVGGVWGEERGGVVVGADWSAIGSGRSARVADLQIATHPDGRVKQAYATLVVREEDGSEREELVTYNGPLSSGFGTDLLLLVRQGQRPSGATFVAAGETCTAALKESCVAGGVRITLLDLPESGGHAAGSLARVTVETVGANDAEEVWLLRGRSKALPAGGSLALDAIQSESLVMLRRRHSPGNPWALLSAVIMLFGLGLMWRRFVGDTHPHPKTPKRQGFSDQT
jgi:hypothetical protein